MYRYVLETSKEGNNVKYYIGVDLGGTNIVAGVVDENYRIISKASTKTKAPRSGEEICKDIVAIIMQATVSAGISLSDIESIGIGTPGIANSENGVIEYSCNLGFFNFEMVRIMREMIDLPVYIENDANAAAYGEFLAGSAKHAKDAVCITLGTGVGGGIIIDGKIYSGFNFAGAELGHTVVDPNGPECGCGRKGCFEVFSSATGLIRMTREAVEINPDCLMAKMGQEEGKISGRLSFNAMRAGCPVAKEVCDKYIKYLALGITNMINIFQPDVLCIGGGVCNEGDALLIPVKEIVKKEVYTRNSPKNTEIVIASLGNDAGIIGAAFLGLNKQK